MEVGFNKHSFTSSYIQICIIYYIITHTHMLITSSIEHFFPFGGLFTTSSQGLEKESGKKGWMDRGRDGQR